ncbi:hypothetical protein SERLA73DRAFT_57675 [Serpula lacrymans var. lacrymans S7.3]|uniref:Oxidoreductase AflY n=1 Tax=Serpula lacrymans var. lacrymans (strain S7.3) TaxID=936435 RepID=F8Q2L5_SERL3|nr:hypothetical protein SERLA73DRAFT_57675 [Serpula lacrymans var. lacrymans S7.3]
MNGHTTAQLDTLFPAPSPPPNTQCPQRWYGVNHETTAALQKTLKKNHTKWHIFFNDRGFHNHIAHHTLALYALGASAPVIEAAYELDSRHQRALFESPEAITEENFIDHLGDEKFYKAYLTFFTNALLEKGAAATLEKFVFSDEYNYEAPNLKDGQSQPKMLVRFYDALMHTMIHVGYGLEFGLMGMVVEGLYHLAAAAGRLASLTLEQKPFYTQCEGQPTTGTHAFSILQSMLADDRLTNIKAPQTLLSTHTEAMDKYGAIIAEHAASWTVDLSKPGELERKVEELSWVNAIFYAIGGWNEGSDFNSDFFLQVTFTAYLTP